MRGKAMFQIRNAANASKTVKRHDIFLSGAVYVQTSAPEICPMQVEVMQTAPHVPKATCLCMRERPPTIHRRAPSASIG